MGIPAYENNHQNRHTNVDTISQIGIISKATRCPQSYSFIIIYGIYLEYIWNIHKDILILHYENKLY
jgi:hypothetical protein